MTDREIDVAIAIHLFDWRWMKYQTPNGQRILTGLFPPDAPNRIPVPNGYDRIWQPSDADAPRFSDWENPIWWDDGEMQRGIPHYSTDPTACALVLDEIERRGWKWEWRYPWSEENLPCFFELRGKDINGYILESSVNRYRAVCLAVLRAVGVEV